MAKMRTYRYFLRESMGKLFALCSSTEPGICQASIAQDKRRAGIARLGTLGIGVRLRDVDDGGVG